MLENKSFFSNLQSGFRTLLSTTDHLLVLETEICHAFISSQSLTVISLDIKKGFRHSVEEPSCKNPNGQQHQSKYVSFHLQLL